MKIPLGWLSMYADISGVLQEKGIQEFSEAYSIYTAEVEEMDEVGHNDLIVVGKVLSVESHPEADKLSITQVNAGKHGTHQIVCGAANIGDATYVAVALEGCQLAPDFVIGRRELRGVDSCGMICSEDELGLQPDRSPGIMILEQYFSTDFLEKNLGTPFHSLSLPFVRMDGQDMSYPLHDVVMDLDNKFITNRPDLFGVYGNARECATIYELPLAEMIGGIGIGSQTIQCDVSADGCTNYTLTKYSGVTVKASPLVIKTLLHRSGLGVKNNLVDLTNLISTEIAQPMHCFDADAIQGHIRVREARVDESFEALDGETYTLHEGDIVIADDSGVIGLAGIIGGQSTAVNDSTTNIIVEAATFDAVQVRKTASRLGLRTDASMRFEKHQNPHNPERAQARFAQLLGFCSQPDEATAMYQYKATVEEVSITCDWSFVETKIGAKLDRGSIVKQLESLGFEFTQNTDTQFCVIVPAWRATKDVTIPEDIVEEIARLQNYNTLPTPPLRDRTTTAQIDDTIALEMMLSDYFVGQGLYDAYTYTFTSEQRNQYYQDKKNQIEVAHSYSEDHAVMRRSLFDSLLGLVQDQHRQYDRFGFFESGSVFGKDIDGHQKRVSLGVLYGYTQEEAADILAGAIQTCAHISDASIRQSCPQIVSHVMHPKKTGTFVDTKGNELIAYGYLHPLCAAHYDLDADDIIVFAIVGREHFFDKKASYKPLSRFPGIDREMNFVMDATVPVGDICEMIDATHPIVSGTYVIEVYEDEQKIGAGKKSVLFACRLQDPSKTLTDEEALDAQNKIIDTLKKQDIQLRA